MSASVGDNVGRSEGGRSEDEAREVGGRKKRAITAADRDGDRLWRACHASVKSDTPRVDTAFA